jgi:tetratricopeptide (TPR) repeat protein
VAGWAVWFYLYKAIVPLKLSFIYPRWNLEGSLLVSYLPLIALSSFFILFWCYRNGWGRPFLFGLGYFVVTLFPVLGFFDINFMRFSFVTDHWQYTSIIGVIALAVGLGSWTWNRWNQQSGPLPAIASVALISLLSVLTWNRCHAFKNLESLWRDTISKNSQAWMAHSNLGSVLATEGRFDEATYHCSEAVRANPKSADAHYNLGLALAMDGRRAEAVKPLSNAVRLNPDFAEAHLNLGVMLDSQGRLQEALVHFSEALRIKPGFPVAESYMKQALREIQGRNHVNAP